MASHQGMSHWPPIWLDGGGGGGGDGHSLEVRREDNFELRCFASELDSQQVGPFQQTTLLLPRAGTPSTPDSGDRRRADSACRLRASDIEDVTNSDSVVGRRGSTGSTRS